MKQSLPKIIKSKQEINEVIQQGERRKTENLIAFLRSSPENDIRFCVLVSNKTKGAVKRNRIKRLLREVVRKNTQPLKIRGSVVLLYPFAPEKVSYAELEAEFRSLFS